MEYNTLTNTEIPSSVQVIEEFAFYKCYSLENVKFNEGLLIFVMQQLTNVV